MSDWKAYRVAQGVSVSMEQASRIQQMFYGMLSNGEIAVLPGSEEVGPIAVSTARTAEGEYRVPVRTPGMIKASWEDGFGVPWQAWVAEDGEVVKVYMFAEPGDLEEDELSDGEWVEQAGICYVLNRVGA
jgi:hypothetical protein